MMRLWIVLLLLSVTAAWGAPTPLRDRNSSLYTVLLKNPKRCADAKLLLSRYHFHSSCPGKADEEVRVLSAEFFGKSVDAAAARLARDRAVQSVRPTRHFPRAQ